MFTKIRAWLSQATQNINRIGNEPILIVGIAMEALHAYEQAQAGGLGVEDAATAAVIAVLTLLGRQLVYPAAKVDTSSGSPVVIPAPVAEEPLGAPYTGESE